MRKRLIIWMALLVVTSVSAGTGALTVITDPSEAKIFVDGQRKGTSSSNAVTPFKIELEEGQYKIEVVKIINGELFKGVNQDVYVSENSEQVISISLQPQKVPTQVQTARPNIPIITDPDELRAITDAYRSSSERPNDFMPQGDGTVIDMRTGLQWTRCSLGQEWTGKVCEGAPDSFSWEQAKEARYEFAGYADWRLPNIAELETLVYCRSGEDLGRRAGWLQWCIGENRNPTIARQVFLNTRTDGLYWSSSSFGNGSQYARSVDFYDGNNNGGNKNNQYYVRLVRGGQ